MGKHEQRDPWREEWARAMRPLCIVVAHVVTGYLIHACTVWIYYTVTH